MAYLYNYAGQPWKTQELVHQICKELYTTGRDGLCGNEDCGQMSAWYVLSAMGFYPVTPGSDIYAIGTPLFDQVVIHLENGKDFIIKANSLSDQNFYISSAILNGKPYSKSYLKHADIMNGGELVFLMSNNPSKSFGTAEGDYPVSAIRDYLITPVPSIDKGQGTFMDSTLVSLSCPLKEARIYYTLDETAPDQHSNLYLKPFIIRKNTTLKAFAFVDGMPASHTIESRFFKIPEKRNIQLFTTYSSQYSGGGDNALIDFARGGENFRTGTWQGYEGVDIEAIVDLGSSQNIRKISLGCLQDQGSWIFMPSEVNFYISGDGKNFTGAASVKNDIDEHESGPVVKEFVAELNGIQARYLKVVARNRGVCPGWHAGAGNKAWIFADEITIE
jgi:hypothetical protein